MNFYELYNILNENTVSQELKKIKTIQDKFYELDSFYINGGEIPLDDWLKYTQDKIKEYIPKISDNSLKALAKWIVYRRSTAVSRITGPRPEIGVISVLINGHKDFLTSALDDNGNFSPQLISKFNNPQFKYTDFSQLDNEYHDNLAKGNIRMPGRVGKTILKFNDGYEWVDLERGYCDIESKSMGHCGNEGAGPGDTILSLRDTKNIPYLTFILNNGDLTQMKGRGIQGGNSKPHPKYHKYIVELLKLPIIKRVVGGGYMPETNFKISDLNEEEIKKLLRVKPELEDSYYLGQIKDKRLPDKVYESLLSWEDADGTIIHDIAASTYTPKEVLNNLWDNILSIISHRPDRSETKDQRLFSLKSGLAANPNTRPDILEELIKETKMGHVHIRSLIASNPSTPPKILIELSKDHPGEVVSNPSSPKDLVEKLFNSEDNKIKWNMAQTATNFKLLEKLSKDPSNRVRYSLTGNMKLPPEILLSMSKDEADSIRYHVAFHPNCPAEALRILAKDTDSKTRLQVAINPNCPTDVLKILANDPDEGVSNNAKAALGRRRD